MTPNTEPLRLVSIGLLLAVILSIGVLINLPSNQVEKAHTEADIDTSSATEEIVAPKEEVRDLLANGLNDWNSWLGSPHHSTDVPGMALADEGEKRAALGYDNDPMQVFSLIKMEGKPTLKISGVISGSLITKEVFEDYHLSLRFRWGNKISPSMLNQRIHDSGVFIHSFGKPGNQFGYWLNALECQLRDGRCGDVGFLDTRGNVPIQVERNSRAGKIPVFNPSGNRMEILTEARRRTTITETRGWNTINIYALERSAAFAINGKISMLVSDIDKKHLNEYYPLSKGKIQLQSIGSELYFQDIKIRPLSDFPDNIQELFKESETNKVGALVIN